MRRLLTFCTAAAVVFSATSLATSDDVLAPPWVHSSRTVFAEWYSWMNFPGPIPPDYWESVPSGLQPDPQATTCQLETPSLAGNRRKGVCV